MFWRGPLGLNAMAALIRLSVSDWRAEGESLAADGLRRHRAKRMAGHANVLEVQPPLQLVPFGFVPAFELVEYGRHVFCAEEKVFKAGRLPHGCHAFGDRFALPDRVIASWMLQKHGHVTARGPMLAEIRRILARAAEAVAEKHDWRRRLCGRQIDPQRYLARAGVILQG